MAAQDPYPGRLFEDALQLLKQRFPDGDLAYYPSNGDVFVTLPLKDGRIFRAGLTWQQAKYLAYSELTGDELKSGQVPSDWPASAAP